MVDCRGSAVPPLALLHKLLITIGTPHGQMILEDPIETWPTDIQVLMAWYSEGFPLQKAVQYAEWKKPFLINDLHMQEELNSRIKVRRVVATT